MTNPYEASQVQPNTVTRKTSRCLMTYALLHGLQAMVATAWVYFEPKQVIENRIVLLFGEMCFAGSGIFLVIGLTMFIRAVLKATSISFWTIDLLASTLVFILGLPAIS